jgi:hypothetical protein
LLLNFSFDRPLFNSNPLPVIILKASCDNQYLSRECILQMDSSSDVMRPWTGNGAITNVEIDTTMSSKKWAG